ncbi:hypothetical protein PVAP13_7KG042409 [Panicum virgatum]|uniref:Secreted protein n=1 Tax=Panicum virgatum TaxID=38727 RepID=A0A8T0QK92_PANVG|nr:hypothetical protein PVAP13_7KG042409 [Panicum virgatum]
MRLLMICQCSWFHGLFVLLQRTEHHGHRQPTPMKTLTKGKNPPVSFLSLRLSSQSRRPGERAAVAAASRKNAAPLWNAMRRLLDSSSADELSRSRRGCGCRYWVRERWMRRPSALPAPGRGGRRRTGGANPDQGAYCKYSDRDY